METVTQNMAEGQDKTLCIFLEEIHKDEEN